VSSVPLPTLGGVDLVIERRPYGDAAVQELVDAVQAEYVVRYGGPDEARVDPADFEPPRGEFLIGLLDGVPVAMGGWRLVDTAQAEIKRMYVARAARRLGLSRLMLARIETCAAAAGVRRLVLNTGLEQPEAIALYETSGYERIDGFGHYADAPAAVFYGKELVVAVSPADRTGEAVSPG
jgi:GNAT superfamily N-acetyltransferase